MEAVSCTHSMSSTHQSLFAGLETWTVAMDALHGSTTMASDQDEQMIQIHAVIDPQTDLRQADINDLSNAEGYTEGNIDILTGSFPYPSPP
eukprot:10982513-Heterocapsa_arctica.AAC.1